MGLRIQRPQIGAALQRLFRLTGRVGVELEPFIIGTVQVADLGLGAEPPVRRSAVARFTQAAVVGEIAVWRMEVPGSVIAVVTRFQLRQEASVSACHIHFGSTISAAVFATAARKSFTDGRLLQGGQTPALVLAHGTQAAGLSPIDWSVAVNLVPDNTWQTPSGLWVIGSGAPGQFGFIEFQAGGVTNQEVRFVVEWDEYQIV